MDIKGTVTVSLTDYTKLIEEFPKAQATRNNKIKFKDEININKG